MWKTLVFHRYPLTVLDFIKIQNRLKDIKKWNKKQLFEKNCFLFLFISGIIFNKPRYVSSIAIIPSRPHSNLTSEMASNVPAIYTWGKKIQEELNLSASRREFTFPFEIGSETPREVIIDFIRSELEITDFNPEQAVIVHKTIPQPGLKWHIDDCVINNRKEPPTFNLEQYILLEANTAESKYRYLYFNTPTKRLPRMTLLFYSSTYGEDFMGGKLCLSDGVEILPQRGQGLLLDSREVHMVTPVKSGDRRVSVVKIY